MLDIKHRIHACLVAGCYADALGSASEGLTAKQIASKYPGGLRSLVRAGYTDDSEMTLALLKTLSATAAPKRADFYRGYATAFTGNGYSQRTRKLLLEIRNGKELKLLQPNISKTNGCIMRAAPFGLIPYDSEKLLALLIDDLYYTHHHDTAVYTAFAYCRLLQRLIYKPFIDWRDVCLSVLEDSRNCPDLWRNVQIVHLLTELHTHDPHFAHVNINEHLSGNKDLFQINAVDCFAVALYLYLAHPNRPLDAVLAAVNMGGDTDTVAKIVAELCGATYGLNWLPAEHRKIKGMDEYSKTAQLFANKVVTNPNTNEQS